MAHLLIIDDDLEIRKIIRSYLEGAGHRVIDADDGRSGLLELRRGQVDLVITDIFMPGQEGIETIRMFKKLRPGLKIIAISGSLIEGTDYLDQAMKLGADRVLAKPFRRKALLDLVDECLERPGA